ncbi:MAG: DNA mismatch repair endonuclease MutL [Chloroflexi bacterium]|nr:DNA mismatch repair endonuclease MutL [Chloroflexota bacterium]
MPIKVLSPDVVAKIAAGEAVERPASVVKELIENSLDAGATEISVEARGGGVAMIRISDNGAGIPAAEATLAFRRHATNKISGLKDLENIRSLGFRGEALASIAAVAQVEMLTQTGQEEAGVYLLMKDNVLAERTSRVRTPGTTVTVRNLFSSVPARLKFLKSAATESGHIANVVNHYALAFPEVKFSLFVEGRLALQTPGNGNLRDCLAAVYGLEVAQAMLEAPIHRGDEKNTDVTVIGLISPPAVTRANQGYLSFFVNRRWVRSRTLTFAVEDAYKGLLMTGKHPLAVLNIVLPFPEVDVNVHPTKMEVRFRSEQAVFAAVQKVVKQTLIRQSPVPEIEVRMHDLAGQAETRQILWEDLSRDAPARPPAPPLTPVGQKPAAPLPAVPILRVLGQLSSAYIIAEGPEGLYLIDQHAAHERVLYEDLKLQRECQDVTVQGMLEPLSLELTGKQALVLKEKSPVLAGFGFNLEPFGETSYLVRGVPAVLKDRNIAGALMGVIDALAEGQAEAVWEEIIAVSLACHAAVKAGQTLGGEEMRELVRLLEKSKSPRTCPHGRPTMLHLSSGKLEKEFGRR